MLAAQQGSFMHNTNELTDEECGHLARILIASRRVTLRHHFFSWVHGPVQSLIPHEILLCGVADESGYLLHERFTACRYFKDDHYQRVIHPGDGLINQLSQEWQAFGEPRLIAAITRTRPGGWHARLSDLELKNVAFHGMGWINGQIKGYASFSRVRVPFDGRLELYLDILLPHLLATLARVLANEARARPRQQASRRPHHRARSRSAHLGARRQDQRRNRRHPRAVDAHRQKPPAPRDEEARRPHPRSGCRQGHRAGVFAGAGVRTTE